MKTNKKTIIGLAAVLTLALAAIAYAHGGYNRYMSGYGGHMMGSGYGGHMMGPGYGGHMMEPGYGGHMMGYGPGYGPHMRGYDNWGGLSDEDAAKLDAAQEKFFQSTRDLRSQIEEKQFALRDEMNQENPDRGKVLELQKALSGLQAEFDQKALAHRLDVAKLLPKQYGRGLYGQGYGSGYGGDCW
jgi:Spy/CpxP family protein refolding chaperone